MAITLTVATGDKWQSDCQLPVPQVTSGKHSPVATCDEWQLLVGSQGWFRASIYSSVAKGDKVVIALANCNKLLLPITPTVATVGMWQLF